MNFKTGDKVVVISGKDKGKEGKALSTAAVHLQARIYHCEYIHTQTLTPAAPDQQHYQNFSQGNSTSP